MKRILIVGTSGCGKTTLAKKLGRKLNLPYFDVDDYYWDPKWQRKDKNEFFKTINNLTAKETWIFSGNFSNTKKMIWVRCDTIIWLDYKLIRCLFQAFIRSSKRILFKQSCCNGNYESLFLLFFSRNSIFAWILSSYYKRRNFYKTIFNNPENNKNYIKFKSSAETHLWVNQIK